MEREANPVPRRHRWLTLFGIALALTLVVGACLLYKDYAWMIPRPFRRRLSGWFLQAMLVAHVLVLVVAPLATVGLGAVVISGRILRRPRPRMARLLLLFVSLVIGLCTAEVGAARWRAWKHRYPDLPMVFPDEPKTGEPRPIEIVVIGESSARGDPYSDPYHPDPGLSVGMIVGWQLGRAFPERKFHVEILAVGGSTLEQEHQRLTGLKRRPDVLIVYAGHNEFHSRFAWDRAVPPDEPSPSLLDRFQAGLVTPLGRTIREELARNGVDLAPPSSAGRRLVDWPVCTTAERGEVRDDFERRLDAIVSYCERIEALAVLVIPPGNDAGYEPNRSYPAGRPSAGAAEAIAHEFLAAKAEESRDPARALALYRDFLSREPQFAEAHYRVGRLLHASGDFDDAYREYVLARDLDGFPQRCPTGFQDTYRAVARRHPSVLLIDGQAVFRALDPRGLLDDHLFHDGQHPVLVGHVALAQAILDSLRQRHALGWPDGIASPRVDPEESAGHFGLDAQRWAYVCASSARFYERTAHARYDPSTRLSRSERYWKASREVLKGRAPEQTGIPGLGARPDLSAASDFPGLVNGPMPSDPSASR